MTDAMGNGLHLLGILVRHLNNQIFMSKIAKHLTAVYKTEVFHTGKWIGKSAYYGQRRGNVSLISSEKGLRTVLYLSYSCPHYCHKAYLWQVLVEKKLSREILDQTVATNRAQFIRC